LTPGRSVVAITASKPGELPLALDALDDSDSRRAIRGGAAFIRSGKVESAISARAYAIGEIPWSTGLWYRITSRPWLGATLAGGALRGLAAFGWGLGRGLGALRRSKG